jgi:hypothetical protein
VKPFIEEVGSGFGARAPVRHSVVLPNTPAIWAGPAMSLGNHPPQYPPRE